MSRVAVALVLLLAAAAVTPASAAPAQRPVEVTDVVQTRRISEASLDPDGRRTAMLITEPSIADNAVTSRVIMVDLAAPHRTRTVTTVTGATDRITNLRWAPDGRSLTYIAGAGGADEVWTVPADGGRPRRLFDAPGPGVPIGGTLLNFGTPTTPPHTTKVLTYEWAPTGGHLAFTTPRPAGDETGDGVVYDDTTMGGYSILHGLYDRFRTGVWVLDRTTRRPRHLIDLDTGPVPGMGPRMTWSPDGNRLTLTHRSKVWVIDVHTGQPVPGDSPVPAADPPPTRPGCSPETAGRALCVREGVATPPRVTVLDVATGVEHEAYNPNAGFDRIRILPPTPAEWTNRLGHKATGYQIIPPGCGSGRRCPAVVITHGYDAVDKFMPEANEWQYPSQVFAARGYVVLLVNESRQTPVDDLWQGRVATMEAAVESAVAAGHTDPDKVGIMGYSRGAETAQLAISHSTRFKAASSGEGGAATIGYWFFGAQNPGTIERAERVFGGSPVDPDAVDRWREVAPDLRADTITAPLLFQAAEPNAVASLELHTYLKARDLPTKLVIFPNESHVFHQPRHRAAAMHQNLEWFDRWLMRRDTW